LQTFATVAKSIGTANSLHASA